ARDAEGAQAVIAGVEIGSEDFLLLTRETERAVEEQRRFERPRRAGGRLIHFRVAAGIRVVRIGPQVIGQVVDDRLHVAELRPDLLRRGAVPVDLDVVVLTIDRSVLLTPIVVHESARADPLYV